MRGLLVFASLCAAVASFAIGPAAGVTQAKMECVAPAGGQQIANNAKGTVWTTSHEDVLGLHFNRWWGCSYSYGRTVLFKGFRGSGSSVAVGHPGSRRIVRKIGRWSVTLATTATRPDCNEVLTRHRFHASLATGNVKWLHRAAVSCTG